MYLRISLQFLILSTSLLAAAKPTHLAELVVNSQPVAFRNLTENAKHANVIAVGTSFVIPKEGEAAASLTNQMLLALPQSPVCLTQGEALTDLDGTESVLRPASFPASLANAKCKNESLFINGPDRNAFSADLKDALKAGDRVFLSGGSRFVTSFSQLFGSDYTPVDIDFSNDGTVREILSRGFGGRQISIIIESPRNLAVDFLRGELSRLAGQDAKTVVSGIIDTQLRYNHIFSNQHLAKTSPNSKLFFVRGSANQMYIELLPSDSENMRVTNTLLRSRQLVKFLINQKRGARVIVSKNGYVSPFFVGDIVLQKDGLGLMSDESVLAVQPDLTITEGSVSSQERR